ncbi:AraC family transcriptional regulator [Enterococcus sp. 2201sp1_2201st1_C11_2201SCRN_220225]|uniref:AraC family transcriptional regulator n=2 Tax=unclassified Enterococcus TaxID=2608891 RepID=UPI0034A5931B
MSNYLEITHLKQEFPFRAFLNDGWAITYPHFHKEIEIIHTKKGKVNIGVGQKLIELAEGETYFFPSGQPHYFLASPDSERCVFQFDLLMFDEVNLRRPEDPTLFALFEQGEPLSRNWPADFAKRMTDLLLALFSAQEQDTTGERFRIIALLHLLVADFYRELPSKKERVSITQPAAVKYQETLDQLNVVFDLIENHYQESLTLEEVAKEVGFSPYYFTRFFKKNTGQTFGQFLTDYRVNQAKFILASEKIPMVEVAEKAGFASVKTFHHVFKEAVGISPLKYQKNILKG